jgi:hypothetical protein
MDIASVLSGKQYSRRIANSDIHGIVCVPFGNTMNFFFVSRLDGSRLGLW